MQTKRWLTLSNLAAVIVLSLCSSGQVIAQTGQFLGPNPDPGAASEATLAGSWSVDYTSLPPGVGNGAGPVYTDSQRQSWAADDFILPADGTQPPGTNYAGIVRKVTFIGFQGSIPSKVNIYFYRNNGTLPGTSPVFSAMGVSTVGIAGSNFYVNTLAVLPPNQTYWVSVQQAVGNAWYWAERSQQPSTSASAWKLTLPLAPGEAQPLCYNAWGLRVATCEQPYPTNSKGADLAFKVEGDYVVFLDQLYLPNIAR
jgi:hypothetical protein